MVRIGEKKIGGALVDGADVDDFKTCIMVEEIIVSLKYWIEYW